MAFKESDNYIVYKHTSPSGKVYIGITSKSPQERWVNGFGYSTQRYFFRAIVKYGWINFKHEILFEGLTLDEAKSKEIQLIEQYKSTDIHFGYNIDLGGDSHVVSKETREAISKGRRGKKWTPERRKAYERYKDRKPGRPVYKYSKNGNFICKFDNVPLAAEDAGVPVETLRTWLCLHKTPQKIDGFYSYTDFNMIELQPKQYKTKAVLMFDLSGNFIQEFSSISEAGKFLHARPSHIPAACRGERVQALGYKWRYKYED